VFFQSFPIVSDDFPMMFMDFAVVSIDFFGDAPRMGHMTTKLPSYMPDLGKLVTAMNLNLATWPEQPRIPTSRGELPTAS